MFTKVSHVGVVVRNIKDALEAYTDMLGLDAPVQKMDLPELGFKNAMLKIGDFGAGAAQSVALMVVLSAILLIWIPLFNWLFDLAEWRLTRRRASDRPHTMRALHAFGMEATSLVVTVPAIMIVGGHGFWEAVAVDIGLSIVYVIYAYVFHILYDRFRPVTKVD